MQYMPPVRIGSASVRQHKWQIRMNKKLSLTSLLTCASVLFQAALNGVTAGAVAAMGERGPEASADEPSSMAQRGV